MGFFRRIFSSYCTLAETFVNLCQVMGIGQEGFRLERGKKTALVVEGDVHLPVAFFLGEALYRYCNVSYSRYPVYFRSSRWFVGACWFYAIFLGGKKKVSTRFYEGNILIYISKFIERHSEWTIPPHVLSAECWTPLAVLACVPPLRWTIVFSRNGGKC